MKLFVEEVNLNRKRLPCWSTRTHDYKCQIHCYSSFAANLNLTFFEWKLIAFSFEHEGSRLVFTLRLSKTWFSKIQGLFCTRYSAPDSCSQSSISLSHRKRFRQITKKGWNIICSLAHSGKLSQTISIVNGHSWWLSWSWQFFMVYPLLSFQAKIGDYVCSHASELLGVIRILTRIVTIGITVIDIN